MIRCHMLRPPCRDRRCLGPEICPRRRDLPARRGAEARVCLGLKSCRNNARNAGFSADHVGFHAQRQTLAQGHRYSRFWARVCEI